jgi:hypothetical protein
MSSPYRPPPGGKIIAYDSQMSAEAWEFLFMMLALKIPIVYLGIVVWYAIKAEPDANAEPEDFSIWRPWRRPSAPRPRRGGPHGSRDSARVNATRRDRVAP